MRWVTVLTEHGPRACGDWHGQYIDVNAADPESPASVRELLVRGNSWMRRAWDALQRGPVRHAPASATLRNEKLMPAASPMVATTTRSCPALAKGSITPARVP